MSVCAAPPADPTMSLETILRIVDRASRDDEFLDLLLTDPTKALKGEDLTSAERTTLKGLRDSPYTSSPRGLADVRKMVLASLAYGGDEPAA